MIVEPVPLERPINPPVEARLPITSPVANESEIEALKFATATNPPTLLMGPSEVSVTSPLVKDCETHECVGVADETTYIVDRTNARG